MQGKDSEMEMAPAQTAPVITIAYLGPL